MLCISWMFFLLFLVSCLAGNPRGNIIPERPGFQSLLGRSRIVLSNYLSSIYSMLDFFQSVTSGENFYIFFVLRTGSFRFAVLCSYGKGWTSSSIIQTSAAADPSSIPPTRQVLFCIFLSLHQGMQGSRRFFAVLGGRGLKFWLVQC